MSQLRQEDSQTVVSMLHRHCTNNGSTSATSPDMPDEDNPCLPLDNVVATSELTDQSSKLSPRMTECPEKDVECATATVLPRCPVCGKSLQWVGGNEVLLNKHVDVCLNRVAVNELLATEKQTSVSK